MRKCVFVALAVVGLFVAGCDEDEWGVVVDFFPGVVTPVVYDTPVAVVTYDYYTPVVTCDPYMYDCGGGYYWTSWWKKR